MVKIALPADESTHTHTVGRTLLQLAHVIVRLEDRMLTRNLNLSYRQMRILKHVNSGVTSGSKLGQIFGVTPPAISETLESLVRKKLIKREPHETDRRAVKLALTEEGKRLNALAEQVEETLSHEILLPLTDTEIDVLLTLARKLLIPSQEALINRRISEE